MRIAQCIFMLRSKRVSFRQKWEQTFVFSSQFEFFICRRRSPARPLVLTKQLLLNLMSFTSLEELNISPYNRQREPRLWITSKFVTFKVPPSNLCGHCLNLPKFTGGTQTSVLKLIWAEILQKPVVTGEGERDLPSGGHTPRHLAPWWRLLQMSPLKMNISHWLPNPFHISRPIWADDVTCSVNIICTKWH